MDELIARQDPKDAALLRAIAPFQRPVGAGVLARLAATPSRLTSARVRRAALDEAEARAARLARWHLLDPAETAGAVSYRLPPVLVPVLGGRDPARDQARCAAALAAELGDFDGLGDPDLLDVPALAEVLRLALAGGAEELIVRCTWSLAWAASTQYRFAETVEICRRANQVVQHPLIHAALGNAQVERGEFAIAQAHFAAALADVSRCTDRDRARVLSMVAFWTQLYDPHHASDYAEQALALALSAGDGMTECDCLRRLATCCAEREDFGEARKLYQQALNRAEVIRGGELLGSLIRMDLATEVDIPQGESQAALRELTKLLELYQRRGLEMYEDATHVRISLALAADDPAGSLAAAERARSLSVKIGWTRGEVQALLRLSQQEANMISVPVTSEDEHARRAWQYARDASSAADDGGWPLLRKWALQNRLLVARSIGRQVDAAAFEAELGEMTAGMAETPQEWADRLLATAEILCRDGRYADAADAASQAVDVLGPAITKRREMRALRVIAEVSDRQGSTAPDLEVRLQRLLKLYAEDSPSMLPLVHAWIGQMYNRTDRPALAREYLQLSLRGYTEQEDRLSEAYLRELLATLPDTPAHERAALLRAAARLRYGLDDRAAAAITIRELATAVPDRDKEQALRAALALARSAGAYLEESAVLTDLATIVSADTERVELEAAAAAAQRRGEPLQLTVGTRLANLLDPSKGGMITAEFDAQRQVLMSNDGFVLPSVHTRDDLDLDPSGYALFLWGERIGSGSISSATIEAERRGFLTRVVPRPVTIELLGAKLGQPELARHISSLAARSPQAVVARDLVARVIDLALARREQLAAAPSADSRPLTDDERRLVERVTADQR